MITSKLVSAACSRPAANVAATVGSMRCARSPSRSSAASSGSSSTISTRMGDAPHRDAGEAVPASPNYDSREVTLRFEEPMASLNVPLYDPRLVQPMREELTRIGFQELRTPAEGDAALAPAAAVDRVRRPGRGRHGAGAELLHRVSPVVATDGAVQGWQAGVHARAEEHRGTAGARHRGGSDGGVRPVLLAVEGGAGRWRRRGGRGPRRRG